MASPGRKKPVAVPKGKMVSGIVLDPCMLVLCARDQHEEADGFESSLEKTNDTRQPLINEHGKEGVSNACSDGRS